MLKGLLHFALSRATSIQGLWITTLSNDMSFHHGRRPSTTMTHLHDEFQRLSLNRLETIDDQTLEFLRQYTGLSIYPLNCQSLRSHVQDLDDPIVRKADILLLCETWLNDNETIPIPAFNCIIQYKRQGVRTGGVGIYHNQNDTVNIVTPNLQLTARQSNLQTLNVAPVGDICIAQCRTGDGRNIIMAAIYISVNSKLGDIIAFIHQSLLAYTSDGAALLGEPNDKLPMVLAGDFNVNFSKPDSQPLINFLREKLNLTMTNNQNTATTKHGTTLDAVFSRYTQNVKSKMYISYFSYHKPIITKLAIESTSQDQ